MVLAVVFPARYPQGGRKVLLYSLIPVEPPIDGAFARHGPDIFSTNSAHLSDLLGGLILLDNLRRRTLLRMLPQSRLLPVLCSILSLMAAVGMLLLLPTPGIPPAAESVANREQTASDEYVEAVSGNSLRQRLGHLTNLGVPAWHERGQRGQGLRVAVLDSGFRGYKAHLWRSLTPDVRVRSFRHDGNLEARDSQHGILCGEVVHAVAPEADLLFANWEPDTPCQFLEAVRWARGEGARIISCSVIMPDWSDCEGGGPVHRSLAELLGDGSRPEDGLFFACAGNTAERHWCGSFQDDGSGAHQWLTGHADNEVTPWGRERVSVEVCWQGEADYELLILDGAGKEVVRSSPVKESPRSCAVARFLPRPAQSYKVQLRRATAPVGRFHLVVLGGTLRHATAAGSLPFPADGSEVLTVGAVDEQGRRLPYSSCGPNSPRPKPDLVAPVPFPSLWRSRPFAGTSAAAPQAAGIAALLWSRYPSWTAQQVKEALCQSANDLNTPGHDFETGHGQVRLP